MTHELASKIRETIPAIQGWCTPEKALHLCGLVSENRPNICFESGIFGGRSIIAIALALKAVGGGVVYGADPWSVEAALEGDIGKENEDWWTRNVNLQKIYEEFMQWTIKLEVTDKCKWLRVKSEIMAPMFADGTIDFFHQDSNHSELVSCREVDVWFSKMSPRSIWILDDSDWPTQQKAIEKIKSHGFQILSDNKTYMVFGR